MGSALVGLLGGAAGRYSQIQDEKRKEESANRELLTRLIGQHIENNWDTMGPEERQRSMGALVNFSNVDPKIAEPLLAIGSQVHQLTMQPKQQKQIPTAPQAAPQQMPGSTQVPQAALQPMPQLPTQASIAPQTQTFNTGIEYKAALKQKMEEDSIRHQLEGAKASGASDEDLQALAMSLYSGGKMIPLYTQRERNVGNIEAAKARAGELQGKPTPWNVYDTNTGKYRVANVLTTKAGQSFEIDPSGSKIPFIAGPFDRPYKDQGIYKTVDTNNQLRFVDMTGQFPHVTEGKQATVATPGIAVRQGGGAGAAAVLSPDEVNEIAGAIKEGRQAPVLQGLYRNGGAVRAALAKDHDYNHAAALSDWNAVQKNITTLNGTQQTRLRQAINTAPELVKSIENIFSKLQALEPGFNYRLLNRLDLARIKQIPGEPGVLATQLETQIADLTADMASIYMGGNTPTDHALELGAKNLNMNWSVDQFKSAINLLKKNIEIRRNSVLTTPPIGARPNSPYQRSGAGPVEGEAPAAAAPTESDAARRLREKYLKGK